MPHLPPGEVHLWRADLDSPPVQLAALRAVLATDERSRADRFHFERDQEHYTVARGTLRCLLALYLGVSPGSVALRYAAHGKPELAGGELQFNVSHSGGHAVFAFAWSRLGVDIERHRRGRAELQIARRFFSEEEIAALERLPESARSGAFFRCWTRKEAYVKGLGAGLSADLASFDVALDEPPRLLATRPGPGEANRWWMASLPLEAGWSGALAVEAPAPRLRCFEVTQASLQEALRCRPGTQSRPGR